VSGRAGRLAGRAAIVTGAGSGLGRGIARALAGAGARVAILDVNEAGAREAADAIAAGGGEAAPVRCDVTRRPEIDAAVAEVVRRFGAVHILVNNAGWDRPMPFLETDEAFWDRILALNLKAHLHMAQAVLPHMIRQGGGKVVAIASDAGRVGSTGEAVYSAAKGGVIAFTKTLAREMARHRINVNCVCPGPSETPLFQQEFSAGKPGLADALRKAIPWGRLGTPEDVAGAVVFLASDDAEFITGQTLSVSGGLTMV
jgi:2-hydroxycyclohexanecarboxyl-CoA dehydrogenase